MWQRYSWSRSRTSSERDPGDAPGVIMPLIGRHVGGSSFGKRDGLADSNPRRIRP